MMTIITTVGIIKAADERSWPFVCERYNLPFLQDDRYFGAGANNGFPFVAVDTKSITIDRKNKFIKVWTVWLASEAGRQEAIQSYQYYDYSNFGFKQSMHVIDYKNMRTLGAVDVFYNCDGNTINSFNYDDVNYWNNIVPNSTMEQISKRIIKKYNLK